MSFLDKAVSSVTKAVTKAYDGTIGDIMNSSNAIVRGVTGLSNTNQAMIGGSVGTATFLNGNAASGGLNAGSAMGNQGTSLLSSLFGSSGLSDILGSVVKGAVGIGADYFSSQQYYKDQRKLNEQKFGYDRQLADEAYQRDVAMWNMQNAYNAPAQQMERLKSAGLNPNLVYGSGNVTGNTAGSPPSYPQVQYPSSKAQKLDLMRNVLGIFDEYQSIKNQALQNQREAYKLTLQERAMELAEDREKRRDAQSQRQFELMMANLGFQRDKEDTRIAEHNQDRQDKKNAPSAVEKEYNFIENKVGDIISDVVSTGFKYLDKLNPYAGSSGRYKGWRAQGKYNK